MKQAIFTQTSTGSNGMYASFPLWNTEMFIRAVKAVEVKDRDCIFRYGFIGGGFSHVKHMPLEIFEKIFETNPFTVEEITKYFCKDVSMKYGEHYLKSKIKPISKKNLKVGFVYTDFSGFEWLYLGEVEKTVDKYAYYDNWDKRNIKNTDPVTVKGQGFLSIHRLNYPDNIADQVEVLKTLKKLASGGTEQKYFIPETKELKYESGKSNNSMGYRGHERIVTVKFL